MMIKELPLKAVIEKDVVVVGGGTAGCFAAISAAAAGADTALIEKNGVLGGTMTVGGVNFPGLFFAWGKQIIGGPCWELIQRLGESGEAQIPEMPYKSDHHWYQQIRINTFALECALEEACEKSGVDVWFHTMLSHAEESENGVELLVTGKAGMYILKAKKVIDATGDADLVRMLGYECMKSQVLQPATLFVKLSGYDTGLAAEAYVQAEIEAGIRNQELPRLATVKTIMSSLRRSVLDIHEICPLDVDAVKGKAELERRARKNAMQIVRFLRKIKGLEELQVEHVATECAVRESNRIVGEHIISWEDYISGTQYEDTVCNAFYPIDLHEEFGIKQKFFEEGVYAHIPYRALIPKGAKHVLAAGRIISSDTDANSGLRVQAPCMAEGQAAGCAAAIAAIQGIGVKEVKYEELMAELKKQGAVFQ